MKIRILLVLFALTSVTPSFANGPIRRIIRGTVVGAARVVCGAGYVVGAGAVGLIGLAVRAAAVCASKM